jgi:hypothetical protein
LRFRTGCGRPNTDHRCSSCRRVVGSKQEGLKSVARYSSQGNITHVAHKEIANLLVTGEGDGFPLLLLRQLLFDDDAAKVLGLRFSALGLHCGRTKCSTSLPRIWCTSCVPSARSSSIAPIWMRTGIDFATGTGFLPRGAKVAAASYTPDSSQHTSPGAGCRRQRGGRVPRGERPRIPIGSMPRLNGH